LANLKFETVEILKLSEITEVFSFSSIIYEKYSSMFATLNQIHLSEV